LTDISGKQGLVLFTARGGAMPRQARQPGDGAKKTFSPILHLPISPISVGDSNPNSDLPELPLLKQLAPYPSGAEAAV